MKLKTDLQGMRLIIDQKDNEFFLISTTNERTGIISGKLGGGTFKFNTPRGSGIDGLFTGKLAVEDFPFEYTKYSDVTIQHLLDAKSNDEPVKSQTKKEEVIVKQEANFEFFDPELFQSGQTTNPPKSLSRKNRKAWYREMKEWKEANAKQSTKGGEEPTEEIQQQPFPVPEESGNSDDNTADTSVPDDKDNPGVVRVVSFREKAKKDPYCGTDNIQCTLADYPEGYIIAHHSEALKQNLVLGTPPFIHNGKKLFFVCKKESTAQQLLGKLKDHPYYAKFVSDGAMECKVHPVTLIPVEHWKSEALLVVNVYTLLNSEMMLEVITE